MSDDLGSILGVGTTAPQSEAPSLPQTSDADLIARAAVAEGDANNPQSWQNVAGVIQNRMKKTGKSAAEILSEPGQFEAYQNGSLQKVDPNSPAYQAAFKAIQPVLSGDIAVPYDSFYSPSIVAQRGRGTPPFDPKTGTKIGTQLFGNGYNPNGGSDLAGILGVDQAPTAKGAAPSDAQAEAAYARQFGSPAATTTDPHVVFADTKSPVTAAQGAGVEAYARTHGISQDPTFPAGTADKPYLLRDASTPPPKGAYYFDLNGQLHSPDVLGTIGAGAAQGLSDVAGSLNKLMGGYGAQAALGMAGAPGPISATPQADAHASIAQTTQQRNDFNQLYSGSPYATGGRIAGDVAASIPFMATGDEALAPVAAAAQGNRLLAPAADFLGGNAGAGNLLLRGASLGARGAVQGGEGAALTSSASDQPLGQQVAQGAELGGVFEPVAAGVGNVVNRGVNRLVGNIESPLTPGINALADAAVNKYGIPIRAGQVLGASGNRFAKVADDELLGTSPKFLANNEAQRDAWMKAVTSTYGDPSGDVSPSALSAARRNIGAQMNDVASRTTIADTAPLVSKLDTVLANADQVLPDNELAPLQKLIDNIKTTIKPDGSMSGESYQALIKKGGALDSAIRRGGSPYPGAVKDALDDALEASASPEDVAQFQNARLQYKKLMTVAKIAPKADAEGAFNPALLRGAVNTNFKNAAFQGATDLGELAQIGQVLMKPPPNSFTADRAAFRLGPLGAMSALGAEGLAAYLHQPQMALAAGGGALASGFYKSAVRAMQERQFGPGSVNRLLNASPSAQYVPNLGPLGAIGSVGYNRLLGANNTQAAP